MEVVTTLKKIGTSRGLAIRFATTVGGTIFDELHEINDMPGEPMSMEEIRKNRHNKEAPAW